ncbi:MAG: hypothetical protein ABEI06_09200 [Halobacteriaceae archaeon]
MSRFPSPFGNDSDDELFDSYAEFNTSHIPDPGPFLDDHDLLVGSDHLAFHRLTRAIFEQRKVYDMTFNYNLARLNLDTRHPDAGYRYARQAGDHAVLHAEFTPTTPFCPQSHTLTIGSFRAWNGLTEKHEYDVVRVRVHPMHHNADQINEQLSTLETKFQETGTIPDMANKNANVGSTPMERAKQNEPSSRGSDAPF